MKVGFSRPKKMNALSWLIMKIMGTTYSHTYLLFDVPETGQELVYQANRKGVHSIEYSTFKKDNNIIDEIFIPTENARIDALRFCITNLGQPYSFLTLISILFNIKFGDGRRYFICSELVARALKIEYKNIDKITPRDLREILESRRS